MSRALRGERAVDPELVARVQAAVERLGYVPDPAARALASRHGTAIALLVPMLSNALFVDLVEAAQRTLGRAGYQTLIGDALRRAGGGTAAAQPAAAPAGHAGHRPGPQRSTRALIAASGVPCVHLMEMSREPGIYSVGPAPASAAMTRHLLERGHRRIAFAAAQLDPRTMQRLDGWREAMRQAGLRAHARMAQPGPSSIGLGGVMFEQIMGQTPPVDGILLQRRPRRVRCSRRCDWALPCPRAWPSPASTT